MTGTITKAELTNLSMDEALKSVDGVRGLLDALEGASCRPGTVIGPERALYLKGYFSSGEDIDANVYSRGRLMLLTLKGVRATNTALRLAKWSGCS